MRNVMKKGRILLIDEDELFRRRVRHTLEQEEDMEVVGEYTFAEEALSQVATLSPDVVLMDALLPGMDGIEACRQLTKNRCAYEVILLTTCQELTDYAVKAGAVACFSKEIKHEILVTAIRQAYKWRSLRAELEADTYSTQQTEAMVLENPAQFAAKEIHDEDETEWLPPEGNNSDLLQEVTLVMPLAGDVTQLQKFICQAEKTFQANILETIGSWRDTHITLKLQRPVPIENILDELMKMPEVKEAEEKTPIWCRLFSFSKEIKGMSRKRISVTLGGLDNTPSQGEGSTKRTNKKPCLRSTMRAETALWN